MAGAKIADPEGIVKRVGRSKRESSDDILGFFEHEKSKVAPLFDKPLPRGHEIGHAFAGAGQGRGEIGESNVIGKILGVRIGRKSLPIPALHPIPDGIHQSRVHLSRSPNLMGAVGAEFGRVLFKGLHHRFEAIDGIVPICLVQSGRAERF